MWMNLEGGFVRTTRSPGGSSGMWRTLMCQWFSTVPDGAKGVRGKELKFSTASGVAAEVDMVG